MTIRRSERREHYVSINQIVFDDERIDHKGLGVLTYLLSKPDNWRTNSHQLATRFHCNVNTIKRILRDLENLGYLLREKRQSSDGTFFWESTVFESPLTMGQKTSDGKTSDGKTSDGKLAHITNTDSTKTELTKTESEQRGDRRKNEAIDVERWKETYNSHKPISFAAVQVFNAKRLTTIKSLIKDCGGQENALTALSNALDYVSNEPWYQGKDLSFDNFASNGKILQFHERWVSGNGNLTPLARNAESNLDYLRNLETRYAT
jgi:hypothetical protein